MNPNDVIDAYVADVVRRVPGKARNEIGLELRGLLGEMLADRAQAEGRVADDAMVLALLRDFGTPAEVAARYRPPGTVIIPAEQTRSFALLSVGGIALQWALTLPGVDGGTLTRWWLTWGLGALWWPGLMVMSALIGAGLRRLGWFQPAWRPRVVDPERINRGAVAFGLAWSAIGVAVMVALPWISGALPAPLPQVFALDPEFLRVRAPWALLLWLEHLVTLAVVLYRGRQSLLTRRLELGFGFAWIALLVWWLAAGPMFVAKATDDGARAAIGLVILIVVVDLVFKLKRRVTLRLPQALVD